MTLPRPWLITISPLVIHFDARESLTRLADGLTTDEYLTKIWDRRAEEHPPLPRQKRRKWKWPIAAKASNVTVLKRKKP